MKCVTRIVLAGACVPLMACGGGGDESESDFTYGEGDMEQLVVGTWSGSWRLAGSATPATFTLDISRPAGAQSSPLCASREFSATRDDSLEPGSRLTCMSMSYMTLDGLLTVSDGSFQSASLIGDMTVPSLNLSSAGLDLRHASGMTLFASWNGNTWQTCRATGSDGALLAECTLESRN